MRTGGHIFSGIVGSGNINTSQSHDGNYFMGSSRVTGNPSNKSAKISHWPNHNGIKTPTNKIKMNPLQKENTSEIMRKKMNKKTKHQKTGKTWIYQLNL